ncbi:SusD/RagB family nutrient-binding outer membrane lipoprotein [Viscerimonas tarda]
MKKLAYILITFLLLVGINGCTDDFSEINTNPNKLYNVELDDIFAGTVKRTLDMFGQTNFEKWLNFSRYDYLSYATAIGQDEGNGIFQRSYVQILRDLEVLDTRYAGKEEYNNRRAVVLTWKSYIYYILASNYGPIPMSEAIVQGNEVKRSYKYDSEKQIYEQILRNLEEAGDLFDANSRFTMDLKFPDLVFGSEEATFTPQIVKWQKFTNTFRLHIAMHAQNVLERDTVVKHAMAAMANPAKLIASNAENVAPRWGTDEEGAASYYWTRCFKNKTMDERINESTYPKLGEYFSLYLFSYDDKRITKYASSMNEFKTSEPKFIYVDTITRPHADFCKNTGTDETGRCTFYTKHRADGLNQYRRDSIIVEYTMDYVPGIENEGIPTAWTRVSYDIYNGRDQLLPASNPAANEAQYQTHRTGQYSHNLLGRRSRYNLAYIPDEFVKENAAVVLFNWADALFLQAEATLYMGGSEDVAKKFYEDGIRASFDQYGLSAADANAYINQDGIAWRTDRTDAYADSRLLYRANIQGSIDPLVQIYKQHYIADYFNGLEGWNLERRTRVMDYPPFFLNGQSSSVQGFNVTYNYWTERLIYPLAETTKNSVAYYEGVELLRKNSPFKRDERWGDNIFTSLAFAKRNPSYDYAARTYPNYFLTTNCEYYHHKYGPTYADVVAAARVRYAHIDPPPYRLSEKNVLTLALAYAFQSKLCWYYDRDITPPEILAPAP